MASELVYGHIMAAGSSLLDHLPGGICGDGASRTQAGPASLGLWRPAGISTGFVKRKTRFMIALSVTLAWRAIPTAELAPPRRRRGRSKHDFGRITGKGEHAQRIKARCVCQPHGCDVLTSISPLFFLIEFMCWRPYRRFRSSLRGRSRPARSSDRSNCSGSGHKPTEPHVPSPGPATRAGSENLYPRLCESRAVQILGSDRTDMIDAREAVLPTHL